MSLDELHRAIDDCLLRDRPSLAGKARRIAKRRRAGLPADRMLSELAARVADSQRIVAQRREARFSIAYPEALPVSRSRQEIADAIAGHRVVILCGETGSGKTTQLPKICLELGRGLFGQIGHTQPRRIAARSVARRIANELGCETGEAVGYQTRFDNSVGEASRIKLMTDGILLSELRHDRQLRQYDTLIIDEAHERSLNIDFLLGYLRRLLDRRDDLRLIITSATIESEKFSRHFGGAPVLEISGRLYPVDLEYQAEDDDENVELAERVADATARLLTKQRARGQGDILVFLPGERHIVECRELLRRRFHDRLEVLPLFGRLSATDQDRVFRKGGKVRCVLSTNIAETSLTVPGIRYVIDTGLVRLSRYSVRSKVQQLPIEKISQASARQRAGRCGRLENGLCLRLYSQEDFNARPEYTDPEIVRTNLARVILEMETLGLGEIGRFPFVDPPDARYVRDGYRLLAELQAVDETGGVTAIGRQMARLPLDPRIGRMLLAAQERRCLPEMLVVAAALSIPDPRQRPAEQRELADARHAAFADPRSDFTALINLWLAWQAQRADASRSAQRRWCKENFLSYPRMREWQDLVHQLHGLTSDTRRAGLPDPGDYESLHRALLSGLLGHSGNLLEQGGYRGTRGRTFQVFPGSGTKLGGAKWIMAAQLLQTSRLYGHVVAKIDSDWIEDAAAHLLRRQHAAPEWEARSGRVVAKETVSLYGLVLAAGRRVDFGRVDPPAARAVFIREALVRDGKLAFSPPFLEHNHALVEKIRDIEARSRRQDVLVDEATRCAFYDERLPADVCDAHGLRRWSRKAPADETDRLRMSQEMLMRHAADEVTGERFPDAIAAGRNRIPLEYRFSRGQSDDGVTALIPLSLLGQVSGPAFDYLVPGLIGEKLQAMLRSLPKRLRRNFVPVPDYVRALLADLPDDRPKLSVWLADKLRRMSGIEIAPGDFDESSLPPHLTMNFRVVDEDGTPRAEGRDLAALRKQLADSAHAAATRAMSADTGHKGIRQWDFGELAQRVEVERAGHRLTLYPALQDAGDSVDLVLHEDPDMARDTTARGLVRLAAIALPQQLAVIRDDARKNKSLLLNWRHYGNEQELTQEVFAHIALAHFGESASGLPRDAGRFGTSLTELRAVLVPGAAELLGLLEEILDLDHALRGKLAQLGRAPYEESVADADAQRAGLLYPGFVGDTPAQWLARYPVYLRALIHRLDNLSHNLARDEARMRELAPLEERLAALADAYPEWLTDPRVYEFQWLLEELRVSLFAQKLGTISKVSVHRLERYWREQIAGALADAGLVPPD